MKKYTVYSIHIQLKKVYGPPWYKTNYKLQITLRIQYGGSSRVIRYWDTQTWNLLELDTVRYWTELCMQVEVGLVPSILAWGPISGILLGILRYTANS